MSGTNTVEHVSSGRSALRVRKAELLGLYVFGLAVAAGVLPVALALSWVSLDLPSFSVWQFAFFLALAVLAEKLTIRVGRASEVSASFVAYFLSAALLGPLASYGLAMVAQVVHFRRGQWSRNICFAAAAGLEAGLAGLIYWAMPGWFGGGQAVFVLAGIASGLTFIVVNYVTFIPVTWLRRGVGPATLWKEGFGPFLPFHLFFLALCLGLVWIFNRSQSAVAFMLFLLPVLGLIYAFRAYAHQRELARTNGALALRNERLFLQAVASQVTALDLKDNYTARHSAAVSQWATDIAIRMGLSAHDVNITHLASLMHDVGKIGVPDEVLNYPGRLDPVAWAMVETHCQNGFRILSDIDQCEELAAVVLHHHEAYDGSGYPSGKAGEDIPLISRIICVADSYSAMVSDRPYRKRLSTEAAQKELRDKSGIQFDPQVVECFLQLLEEHDIRYQQGEAADFRVEFQKVKYLRDLPPDPDIEAAAVSA